MRRLILPGLIALLATSASGANLQLAVTDEMLDELDKELARAMKDMSVPGEPKPYFVAFKLTEVDVNDVAASLGAATDVSNRHFMGMDSHVRVGDYAFDNTNHLIPRQAEIDGHSTIALPLEATPKVARRAAWLATDAAYKEALEQYRSKKAKVARDPSLADKADSYARVEPLVMMDPVKVEPMESLEDLRGRAERLSAVFRDRPMIRESRVAYTSFIERRWYLNSEGTRAHDVRRVTGVIVVASVQAEDEEILTLYTSHYGRTLADLPSEKELKKEAEELADTLVALRSAPVQDNFTGPVLFESEGAYGVVRFTLAHHLSGTPVPSGMDKEEAERFGGRFKGMLGRQVVSSILSIWDDPTAAKSGKEVVIGGYRFDDEGVKAQKVELVDDGKLLTLLMSRTPSPDVKLSNGHARRQGPGLFHGSPTNLFVSGAKGKSRAALRKAAIAEAKAQGAPYVLIIAQFEDIAMTANLELTPLELIESLQEIDRDAPPPATLAYRLYPDGKVELVRGVQLKPVDYRAWRDVIAVGNKPTVINFLSPHDDDTITRFTGGGEGFVPSAGVESSITTPDLLFKELDVARAATIRPSRPAVPAP